MNIIREYLRNESLDKLLRRTECTAKRHNEFPNLVLLKYNQVKSDMNDPLVQACRGIILDEDDDWKVICHPYDKFFNYGEFQAADLVHEETIIYEKLDGSIINMYYYRGEWRVSTSGFPDASGSGGNSGMTFAELFWNTWNELGYEMPPEDLTNYTFMFELMTPYNKIIVPHEKSRIVLHGVRDNDTDKECHVGLGICKWEVVKRYPLKDIDKLIADSKDMSGIEQEGYVLCDYNFNRVKLKCPSYVALHHFKYLSTPKSFMTLILANEGSEFLVYFPEMAEEFNKLKQSFTDMCVAIDLTYSYYKDIESDKEFALTIKDYRGKHVLFAIRRGYQSNARDYFIHKGAKYTIEFMRNYIDDYSSRK